MFGKKERDFHVNSNTCDIPPSFKLSSPRSSPLGYPECYKCEH